MGASELWVLRGCCLLQETRIVKGNSVVYAGGQGGWVDVVRAKTCCPRGGLPLWRHNKPGGKYGREMVDMAGAYGTKGRAKRTHDYEIKERYGDICRDQQTAQCWNWLAQVYRKLSLYIHCTCMN